MWKNGERRDEHEKCRKNDEKRKKERKWISVDNVVRNGSKRNPLEQATESVDYFPIEHGMSVKVNWHIDPSLCAV